MAINTDEVFLLNRMNSTAQKVQLGTLIETAEAIGAVAGALANGKIFVGDAGGDAQEVTVTGDITLTNAGVSAIGAAKVTKAMLAATVRPSHIVVFAGTFTTAGGDANEQITVTGAVAATDICFVQLHTKGASPQTILTAQVATDAINLVFSADPSTDHVVKYQVLRASS